MFGEICMHFDLTGHEVSTEASIVECPFKFSQGTSFLWFKLKRKEKPLSRGLCQNQTENDCHSY
jgi:hypothetical protein